ncbi:MAG: ATP-binding protein, partial [Candidatus Methylomirabilales bacterium]
MDSIGARKVGLIGAFPIFKPAGFDPPGSPPGLAGAVVLGQVLDAAELESLRGAGQEISLLSRERVLDSTLAGAGRLLTASLAAVRTSVFEQAQPFSTEGSAGGRAFFTAFVPLERRDGVIVAALAVSQPTGVIATTERNVGRTLFILALVSTGLAAAASSVSGSRITRPIRDLTAAAERIRHGDLAARVEVKRGGEEVVALGAAFNEMTHSVSRLTGDLRSAAEEEFGLRSRLETIIASLTEGVVAVDGAGRVLAFNREAERVLRVPADRAMGRSVREVLVVVDGSGVAIPLPIYRLGQGAVTGMVGHHSNGEGRGGDGLSPVGTPVAVTSAPITDERGQITGAVAVVRDLTREMEVERMKTEFLSNVSHELRTPLTPIKGYADLLRRKPISRKKAIAFLDGIIASTLRLERTVEMLVDFSAIEAGRLVPRLAPFDIDAASSELITRWREAAPKHTFERRGFGLLPLLYVDERLLPRAIDELIDNAVKFSPEGGRVVLSGQMDGLRRGAVRISVTDQGIGISEDAQQRIFQGFVQVDASETRQYGGLGLGLA